MPKLSLPEIRALLDEAKAAYKAKFTPGFYHGSPANNIEAFDPSKGTIADVKDHITPNVTFVTPKPEFAESFLPEGFNTPYRTGSTMYPVSVNLGKHFDPNTPEGSEIVKQYLSNKYKKEADTYGFDEALGQKHEHYMDKLTHPVNNWKLLENPEILDYLKSTGHNSFSVTEGGIKNVGVFKPENIRGKFAEFNPEHAADPDFMKAAGGSVEGYAAGGEVLKKVLKFAEDVPFIHYSNHPSLNRLEPSMYGRGIKGQEAARLKDAPDIKDRSYFYVNKGEQTIPPEQGLGSQKYQGTASNVYNAAEDPEGFHAIAKSRALDPYMMSFGREMVDPAVKATELERLIKGAGYEGYHTGDVGLMFHPTPITKID